MITEMTEAEIIRLGKRLSKSALRRQPIKDRLEGIPTQVLLERIPTQDRLEGIPAEARLEGIPTQEVLDAINPEELVRYLQHLPEEKLKLIRLNIGPNAS